MATVFDVARYILHKSGPLPTMKLHRLVYYSQAWSLVWDDKPIFRAKIRAWANGPATPALFVKHRGLFELSARDIKDGRCKAVSKAECDTIDKVLDFYGPKESWWLTDLALSEKPCKDARKHLEGLERRNVEITLASMAEYYGSLQ